MEIGESLEYHHAAKSETVKAALRELAGELRTCGDVMNNIHLAKDYLRLKLAPQQREVFGVMFLSCSYTLLGYEELFYGTITSSSVHFREIAKRIFHYNAAGMIVVHNHPSGFTKPSREDIRMTQELMRFLRYIDVQLLDHLIVGGTNELNITSMYELGLFNRED